jgi:DNA-binding transcriptional LysR family regulator
VARPLTQKRAAQIGFTLSSEQCELLAAFEGSESISDLAKLVGKDVSVVSRQLKRIADEVPALEKNDRKWVLTNLGHELCAWARDAIAAQKRVLQRRSHIRIATTREFASRILAPGLRGLVPSGDSTVVSILTGEEGVERTLLSGQADLGFDCGVPIDPQIRFKRVVSESFSVVAAPSLVSRHGVAKIKDLIELPHLHYTRAPASKLLGLSVDLPNLVASFNDIGALRAACCAGLGWAVLPTYTVTAELNLRQLKAISGSRIAPEQFGVFWSRSRPSLDAWAERAISWLAKQSLG